MNCHQRCVLIKLGLIDEQNDINAPNIAKYIKKYCDQDISAEDQRQGYERYETCKKEMLETGDKCAEFKLITECLKEASLKLFKHANQGQSSNVLEAILSKYC